MLGQSFIIGTVLSLGVAASPISSAQTTPTVTVKNGTYAGIHSSTYNQDYFLGMPFALPPVQGPLRFSPPLSLNTSWTGTKNATEYGAICYGYGTDATRLAALGMPFSEDCLTINVVRPSGYENASLPVAAYIYGGGYYMGGSSDPRLNLSYIVNNSIASQTPVLGVSFNYRVSGFGFLGGSDILKAGATNLGFRDQRLALHWIQENIAAFGGDPTKVTIFGNSAGAGSVGAQLLAYNGRDDGLFRGAIAQSGSPTGFYPFDQFGSVSTWDDAYTNLTTGTGCQNSTNTLDCLRSAPLELLVDLFNTSQASGDAVSGVTYGPVYDGDFYADLATRQLERGDFLKVPFIIGFNTDEGSSFIPGNQFDNITDYPTLTINTDAEMLAHIEATGVNSSVAQKIANLYPMNSTEQELILYDNDLPEELGVQYKRGCTLWGDMTIIAPTRYAARIWARNNVAAYTYHWNVFVAGLPTYVGATHAKEIVFVFDDLKGWDYDVNPFLNEPDSYISLAKTISDAWISFIATGDPNGPNGVDGITWPKYDIDEPQNILFGNYTTGGVRVEPDTAREDSMDYLFELYSQL